MNTALLLLIIITIMATLILVAISWRNHQAWQRTHRANGLLWSISLLKLIMNIQQHRGMATAMLNGDSSFAPRQQQKRQEIDLLLQRLQTLPGDFQRRSEDFDRSDLENLLQQWQALIQTLPTLSAFESMTRHTAIIGTLLSWLRAVGESCLNTPAAATGIPVDLLVATFVERLPVLAETLGQARALGTGLLAAGTPNAVGRVQMGYLCQRIEKLQQDTGLALKTHRVDGELQYGYTKVDAAVQDMLVAIRDGVQESGKSPMNSGDYFRVATTAIDSVFNLIGVLQKRLEVHA